MGWVSHNQEVRDLVCFFHFVTSCQATCENSKKLLILAKKRAWIYKTLIKRLIVVFTLWFLYGLNKQDTTCDL